MASIDDYGSTGQPLDSPPLGGPNGWAKAKPTVTGSRGGQRRFGVAADGPGGVRAHHRFDLLVGAHNGHAGRHIHFA